MRRNDADKGLPVLCLTAVVAATLLGLTFAALAATSERNKDEQPTETLQGLVKQLIALELELNQEETRWQEQKAHLEAMLSLLKKEQATLGREIAAAKAKADAAGKEQQRLTQSVADTEALLRQTDDSIRLGGKRILTSYERLPEPLKGPLANAAARVRDALANKREAQTVPDRLRVVTAFAADLSRVLGSVHLVKQVLEGYPGWQEPEPREVDVLYLGAAIGYYVSPDGLRAGLVVPGPKGWEVGETDPPDVLVPGVRRAMAVFRKEKPATLVKLPIPPGEKQ